MISASTSLVRSFLFPDWIPLPFKSRLVRVLSRVGFDTHKDIPQHVNLRYLHWRLPDGPLSRKLPSSISLLWNVHTFISNGKVIAPSEIWYMRQLRHLQAYWFHLPDPPTSEKVDDALLPNLHTLSNAMNLSFTEDVCKRISNIKKLGIVYINFSGEECKKKLYYNLDHLHKLESLYCSGLVPESVQILMFPISLRKLSLHKCRLRWDDLNIFGLSLPHLEALKLRRNAVVGPEWDFVEGAFPRLKFLHMESLDLIKWTAESSEFFPLLQKLHLKDLWKLEKIPSGIEEIQTLASLRVDSCSVSAAISSLEILEEQLSLGNDDLQLDVDLICELDEEECFREKVEMNNFASKNFKFHILHD